VLAFLEKYPRTARRAEAKELVIRLRQTAGDTTRREDVEKAAWEQAQRADSIPAYSQYLALFGDTDNAPQARQRLTLLTELRDWQVVRESELVGGLQNFIKKYPAGRYAQDARDLMASLNATPPNAENVNFDQAGAADQGHF
jgi:hypothetical protein